MRMLLAALLLVPVGDQAVKLLVRRGLGTRAVPLGPFGSLRMVEARIWLERLGRTRSDVAMWTLWLLTAGALLLASTRLPSSGLFVGLLLGGSLSHGIESSLRGTVSDYVCLNFWPAFNLADVALTAGAIGVVAQLLMAMQGTVS